MRYLIIYEGHIQTFELVDDITTFCWGRDSSKLTIYVLCEAEPDLDRLADRMQAMSGIGRAPRC